MRFIDGFHVWKQVSQLTAVFRGNIGSRVPGVLPGTFCPCTKSKKEKCLNAKKKADEDADGGGVL